MERQSKGRSEEGRDGLKDARTEGGSLQHKGNQDLPRE